jgi:hypothetical protein
MQEQEIKVKTNKLLSEPAADIYRRTVKEAMLEKGFRTKKAYKKWLKKKVMKAKNEK